MGKVSPKRKTKQGKKNELVLTPGGWRPKSKVHQVEPGKHIEGKGGRLKIIDTATGNVIEDLGEIPKANAARPSDQGSSSMTLGKKRKPAKT